MQPGSHGNNPPRDDYRPPAQFLVHIVAMCAAVPPEIESQLRACCTAYKATTKHHTCGNSAWMLKRYLPSAKETIEKSKRSLESHTKKTVQTHALARNFAYQLEKALTESAGSQYVKPLRYNNIYYGVTDENEVVTVEEYVEGTFMKYINNDGIPCIERADDVSKKAECLAHFSYEKSDKKLMVLDIQGNDHTLYDTEIASSQLFEEDGDSEMLFCVGNISTLAIENFITEHRCNSYCISVGLTKLH